MIMMVMTASSSSSSSRVGLRLRWRHGDRTMTSCDKPGLASCCSLSAGCMSGGVRDLCGYDDAAWSSLLAKPELVFARATPQDKLTIVRRTTPTPTRPLTDWHHYVPLAGPGPTLR